MWKVFSANWFSNSNARPDEIAEERFGIENIDIDRILDWEKPKSHEFPTFSKREEDLPSPANQYLQFSSRSSVRVEPSKASFFGKEISTKVDAEKEATPIIQKSKFQKLQDQQDSGSRVSIQDLTMHLNAKQEQALNSSRLKVKQVS